ncbi:MAG: outer membrane beta-barrel protein [Muribaculaceae bacterium]
MKKIFVTLIVVMCAIATSNAELRAGEKSFGPKVGYVSENESAVAGLVFQYNFSEHLRLVPEIGCVFRHNQRDAFLLDVNVHTPFAFTAGDNVNLYPLAGLSLNSWAWHYTDEDSDDVTTHTTRFGLNVGAGFEYRCNATMKLTFEAKYTLIKKYSATYITAGLSYIF